jgi:hypothetical protein
MEHQMWKWIKGLFAKKAEPTAEEAFWASLEQFNSAWQTYEAQAERGNRLRPWIDWANRRVIMSVATFREATREEGRR